MFIKPWVTLLAFGIVANALMSLSKRLKPPRQLGLFDGPDELEFGAPQGDTISATAYSTQSQFASYSSTLQVSASVPVSSSVQSMPITVASSGSIAQPTATAASHTSTLPNPSSKAISVDPNASPALFPGPERGGATSLSSQKKYAIIGSIVGAIVLIALIRAVCAFKFRKRNKDAECDAERFSGVFNRRILTQRASMFNHHV